jgi:hypothetical protein
MHYMGDAKSSSAWLSQLCSQECQSAKFLRKLEFVFDCYCCLFCCCPNFWGAKERKSIFQARVCKHFACKFVGRTSVLEHGNFERQGLYKQGVYSLKPLIEKSQVTNTYVLQWTNMDRYGQIWQV